MEVEFVTPMGAGTVRWIAPDSVEIDTNDTQLKDRLTQQLLVDQTVLRGPVDCPEFGEEAWERSTEALDIAIRRIEAIGCRVVAARLEDHLPAASDSRSGGSQ